MKELAQLHVKDWSLNLEDPYYEEHPEEAIRESIEAIRRTADGCYVNLVTAGGLGHPERWLLGRLARELEAAGITMRLIRYIDECGCGGFVTRVHK